MNSNDNNAELIREAATWMMRLSDESASEADLEAWRQWGTQSEQHQKVMQLAESLDNKLNRIPPKIGSAALNAPKLAGRRMALKTVALFLTAVPTGWLASRLPWDEWQSDYRTGTGARQQIVLPDGSQLTLDTASAVNVVFNAQQRSVELVAGRIFITTMADAQASARPFLVRTQQGTIRALGTQFEVRLDQQGSAVGVRHGAVEIAPVDPHARKLILQAGQRTHFNQSLVFAPETWSDAETLWLEGNIQVNNMRLADFIAELARYRPGVLRCDPAIADLRISGRYRLDDTNAALTLLTAAFPLKVTRMTNYWVSVEPR